MLTIQEREERLRLLAGAAAVLAVCYSILFMVELDTRPAIPRDGTTLVIGRDFLNFWMAGRAAWNPDPQRFYDLTTYQAAVAKVVGPGYLGQVWSYPPSVMLLAAPFGRLPYLASLLLWSMIGPLVLYVALRPITRDWRVQLAVIASPAAIFGLISGQFAFLATAVIMTVLRWRDTRPYAAGALLGLLTIKPQLGLFVPLLLLASGNLKGFGAAAASTIAVIGLSMLFWGAAPWLAYLHEGIATQSRVLTDPEALGGPFMPTLFMNLRSAGASLQLAWALQIAASVLAAFAVLWVFRRKPDERDWSSNALFLAAAVFGTPYLLSYDTLPLTAATILAMPPGRTGRLLLLATFFLTLLQLVFGGMHVPGPALIPLALVLYLWREPARTMTKMTPATYADMSKRA